MSNNSKKVSQSESELLTLFLENLGKIGEIIDRGGSLEDFLKSSAEAIGKTLKHERATIFLYDQGKKELIYLTGWSRSKKYLPREYRQKLRQGLIGKAARLKKPIIAGDTSKEPYYLACFEPKANSEACLPIILKGKLLGVLDLQDSRFQAFSTEEVNFLNFLGTLLAYAIAERQKEQQLEFKEE